MLKMLGVLLLVLVICCGYVDAQDKGLGLGVRIVEPTGSSAKLWLQGASEVDAAAAGRR